MVHKKEGEAVGDAVGMGDGLAVLGFFFETSDENNTAIQPLIQALKDIHFKGRRQSFVPFLSWSHSPSSPHIH